MDTSSSVLHEEATNDNNCVYDSTMLITGKIKWFDAVKGYGFITSDDGGPDVLLHFSTLQDAGRETLLEGTIVHCEADEGDEGRLKAIKITHIDTSTAIIPMRRAGELAVEADNEGAGDYVEVEVKWFDRIRGFGFVLEPEGGPDIFIHMETLRRNGLLDLYEGDKVDVRVAKRAKGPTAVEVRLPCNP